jgi:hypothetical protein
MSLSGFAILSNAPFANHFSELSSYVVSLADT